ncbi:hypothetical protein [Roseimaritima multifibrata]|nr:hypothetical protein [Roseimaritima multifibrata]
MSRNPFAGDCLILSSKIRSMWGHADLNSAAVATNIPFLSGRDALNEL